MEQSTILEYAKQHLGALIEKLDRNLDSDTLSPFQKDKFEKKLAKYNSEYTEICQLLRNEKEA